MERPFKMRRVENCGNECGGISIYEITACRIRRLHGIAWWLEGDGDDGYNGYDKDHSYKVKWIDQTYGSYTRPSDWSEIWQLAGSWAHDSWSTKYKGPLQRAICWYEGNGMMAIARTPQGKIYYISGVWG